MQATQYKPSESKDPETRRPQTVGFLGELHASAFANSVDLGRTCKGSVVFWQHAYSHISSPAKSAHPVDELEVARQLSDCSSRFLLLQLPDARFTQHLVGKCRYSLYRGSILRLPYPTRSRALARGAGGIKWRVRNLPWATRTSPRCVETSPGVGFLPLRYLRTPSLQMAYGTFSLLWKEIQAAVCMPPDQGPTADKPAPGKMG